MGALKKTPTNLNDRAPEVFVLAVVLQILFVAGVYWKISFLTSELLFSVQVLSPASVGLLVCLNAVLDFLLNPIAGTFLKHLSSNFQVFMVTWVVILAISFPAILMGIIVRSFLSIWSRRRTRSASRGVTTSTGSKS